MTDVIWTEDLEAIAEELGLEHDNWDRLQSYVSLVRTYPLPYGDTHEYIRANIEKWIQWEEVAEVEVVEVVMVELMVVVVEVVMVELMVVVMV